MIANGSIIIRFSNFGSVLIDVLTVLWNYYYRRKSAFLVFRYIFSNYRSPINYKIKKRA